MAITNMMALAQGKVNIMEFCPPDRSPVIGRNLMELNIPEKYLIASIIRNDEVLVPRGATILQAFGRPGARHLHGIYPVRHGSAARRRNERI